jgi:predicted dehydrogenase
MRSSACFVRSFARLALVATLAILPGAIAAQAQQPPVRVAIVGLVHGHIGGFLQVMPRHKDVELVGVAEPDSALAASYAKRFNIPQNLLYTDAETMIKATHPQALLVYTSIAGHRPAIELAGKYGVNVMVEKPLTISLDDALAIRKIAREDHIHVLVNYETTWYTSNAQAYNMSEAGQIGEIRRIVVHDGHAGPALIHVQPEFFKWLTDPVQNGAGSLYDFGCYGVDLTTWLLHGATPQSVTAIVSHDQPNYYPKVDDDSTILLSYPHTEAVIQGSWNWPFSRKDMEVYGATGYVITVGPSQVRVRLQHDMAEEGLSISPSLDKDQSDSLDYLTAVLSGRVKDQGDLSALDTNVIVMQILDAARTSVRTGKSVPLTPLPE